MEIPDRLTTVDGEDELTLFVFLGEVRLEQRYVNAFIKAFHKRYSQMTVLHVVSIHEALLEGYILFLVLANLTL